MLTVEHVITADSATGEPWPPSTGAHYCAVRSARRASHCGERSRSKKKLPTPPTTIKHRGNHHDRTEDQDCFTADRKSRRACRRRCTWCRRPRHGVVGLLVSWRTDRTSPRAARVGAPYGKGRSRQRYYRVTVDDLPLVPDVWSYMCWWECWKPAGDDGKNKKTAQIGPLRRVDGILPPLDQLPDRDEYLWELTKDGKRKRDPWGRRNGITLKNPRNGDKYFWRSGYEGNQTLSALFVLYASKRARAPRRNAGSQARLYEVLQLQRRAGNEAGAGADRRMVDRTAKDRSAPPMPTKATLTTLVKAREKDALRRVRRRLATRRWTTRFRFEETPAGAHFAPAFSLAGIACCTKT